MQTADEAAEEAAGAGFVPQPLERADGSGSFSKQRSPLGGRGLVHSDSTVQMQFHMADKMEENPRIWQVSNIEKHQPLISVMHTDFTVQMLFHMADKVEVRLRISNTGVRKFQPI